MAIESSSLTTRAVYHPCQVDFFNGLLGACVKLGTGSTIQDLQVLGIRSDTADWTNEVTQAPLGCDSTAGQNAFTNVTLNRAGVFGGADSLYIRHTDPCSLRAFNCQILSEYDCLRLQKGGHSISIYNSDLLATRTVMTALAYQARAVVTDFPGCNVHLFNCRLAASNAQNQATAHAYGVSATTGSAVHLQNCSIATSRVNASANRYDTYAATGGVVRLVGTADDPALSATATNGAVIYPGSLADLRTLLTDPQGESSPYGMNVGELAIYAGKVYVCTAVGDPVQIATGTWEVISSA